MFYYFLLPFHFAIWASKVSEKFRLDRKIGFQNTFYTKCINVIIDSIGPSIILRSIYKLPTIARLEEYFVLIVFNPCSVIKMEDPVLYGLEKLNFTERRIYLGHYL